MKKYVITGFASLYMLAFSCAQQTTPDPTLPSQGPNQEETVFPDKPERLLVSMLPTIAYPQFFAGTTDYVSTLKPEAWFSRPAPTPNLGSIAPAGKVPKLVAFGGGMTAGVSNGGLNREAQQFTYPNLVAHQMGIANFTTPLLPESEANGTGIFLYEDRKAEYPRWKEVTNNLAKIEAGEPIKMTPYAGEIHNFAYPGGGSRGVVYPYCPTCMQQAYISRFKDYPYSKDSQLLDKIREKQGYDFALVQDFYDGLYYVISHDDRLDESASGIVWHERRLNMYSQEDVFDNHQKGVIFTIPHYKHMGFMNWYNTEDIKKKASSISILYQEGFYARTADGSKPFYLMPTPQTEGIFRTFEPGKPVDAKLSDIDIMDHAEDYFMDPDQVYNRDIRKFASEHNVALVDLRLIYEKIHSGTYITDDGLKIDGSMKGNFFSSDGIYPTPLGQAVIANEVIRSINAKYGAQIPLINVIEFANTVGIK